MTATAIKPNRFSRVLARATTIATAIPFAAAILLVLDFGHAIAPMI